MKQHNHFEYLNTFDKKIWIISLFLAQQKGVLLFISIAILMVFIKNAELIKNLSNIFFITNVFFIVNSLFLFRMITINIGRKYTEFSWALNSLSIIIICELLVYFFIKDNNYISIFYDALYIICLCSIFYFLIRYKYIYNISISRMESWMSSIIYITPPISIMILIHFISRNYIHEASINFMLLYVSSSLFLYNLNLFFSEYMRLRGLRSDMELRDIEIMKLSEKSNEAARLKGEFLANMSHELRTPLNGIIGCATLLQDTSIDDEQREYLEVLRSSGNNLLTIISEILDFSKLEANKLEIESIPFEINSSIEDVFDILSSAAYKKDIDLIYSIENEVPFAVIGDMNRTQQILTNLLDNAIKFTKSGGYAFVHIRTGLVENNRRSIFFTVHDTGVGISKDSILKLFQTFTQLDDSFTRQYGGTGLGLSIAKKLTEMMGGQISVKSILGKGSSFSFFVDVGITEKEDTRIKKKLYDDFNIDHLLNKKIIILENSEKILESMKYRCERWGLVCVLIRSSELDAYIEQKSDFIPDFIIMPYVEKKLIDIFNKKFCQKNNIIFIAIVPNIQDNKQISLDGFHKIISKPIKYSALFDVLTESQKQDNKTNNGVFSNNTQNLGETFPLHILVAEDNVVNQKLIVNVLKKLGYTCDVVANGNEVLEALTRHQYDIIFMDVQMPEMDGIEATTAIINKYPNPQLRPRIIAMTAHMRGPEVQQCMNAGMEGYLPKPLDIRELKQLIQFWGFKINEMKRIFTNDKQ